MRIIKPQQLVLLKAGHQQGNRSTLGISVIAGCYLTRPTQFATEAKIWQAWLEAPHLMPVLDSSEPKPFAEFLLAGHVVRDPPVTAAQARVRVGRLERHWQITGDRHSEVSVPQPFSRIALDHPQAPRGGEGKFNPAGKSLANIMLFNASGADRLVAPSPVPHHFPARQQYLQQVQSYMNSDAYREQVFPGLPESLDPRYFQMAPIEQWLDGPEWPAEVNIELEGFTNDSALRCSLPAVQAVVMAKYRDRQPEMVSLQRKTLLLLPDSDLVLMIFTGQLPLEEVLDESVEELMVGLDNAGLPRDEQHYRAVYARRTAEKGSRFEFLYDPDLMPPDSTLEVIASAEQHPSHPQADGEPQDADIGAAFHHQIRELITQHDGQSPEDQAPPFDWEKLPVSADPVTLIDEQNELSNKTFSGFSITQLKGKTFKHCRFIAGSFAAATLQTCVFENCRFERTCWQGAQLHDVTFQHSTMQKNDLRSVSWQQVTACFLTAETCQFSDATFNRCEWQQCLLAESDLSRTQWMENQWDSVSLDETRMPSSQLTHCLLNNCLFNQCDISKSQLTRVDARATSVLGGNWQDVLLSQCQISSLTVGLDADFSTSHFSHCWLQKLGMKGARMVGAVLEHCSVDVGNFDQAILTGAQFLSSDIAGGRWKDAGLAGSIWQASSIQQGQFYHADLRTARFFHCNLAGAGMAMVRRDAGTHFKDCLLTGAVWLPRSQSTAGRSGTTGDPS